MSSVKDAQTIHQVRSRAALKLSIVLSREGQRPGERDVAIMHLFDDLEDELKAYLHAVRSRRA